MPPAQLHGLVALVPQEVFLFGLSIRENLLFGLPPKYPGNVEHALREALERAAIYEEIEALPSGLDTILGERGLSLSGGQRQRLSLARALLRGSKVLLLDNSLSAVDAETESLILNRLKAIPCAVLCVTHRLSTVTAMDRVLLLEDGRLTQDCTTLEMLEHPEGWLKLFCESQRAEQIYQDFVERISDE
jgi:ABC-type multidrug transport system fused ATPase/permease subunit